MILHKVAQLIIDSQGCGSVLYFDIAEEEAAELQEILDGSSQQRPTGPIIPLHNSSPSNNLTGAASTPLIGQGRAAKGEESSGQRPSSSSQDQAVQNGSPHGQTVQMSQLSNRQSYIHWCIDENYSTTRLKNLDVRKITDASLARSLLSEYGSVRRWQSWWTVSDCVAVKFKKVRSSGFSSSLYKAIFLTTFGSFGGYSRTKTLLLVVMRTSRDVTTQSTNMSQSSPCDIASFSWRLKSAIV